MNEKLSTLNALFLGSILGGVFSMVFIEPMLGLIFMAVGIAGFYFTRRGCPLLYKSNSKREHKTREPNGVR